MVRQLKWNIGKYVAENSTTAKGDVEGRDQWNIFLQPQYSTGYFLALPKVICQLYITYTVEKALLYNLEYKQNKAAIAHIVNNTSIDII
jgi:hypothetical protein